MLNVIRQRVEQALPAAYLTHEAWLGDFRFYVDERVIVPRSFIAELLREQPVALGGRRRQHHRVLDLCTGSGCLAILAALAFPNATVDAVDISRRCAGSGAAQRGRLPAAGPGAPDPVGSVRALGGRQYDLIISNPPYVDAESVAALPAEYLHEPKLALGSGSDGLDATRDILKHAAAHLDPAWHPDRRNRPQPRVLEAAYPDLPFTWLEVAAGDEFVFLLHRNDLPARCMAVDHYENFPVASILLPRRLRRPVEIIYHFARQADDIADEGDLPDEERLAKLDEFPRRTEPHCQPQKARRRRYSKTWQPSWQNTSCRCSCCTTCSMPFRRTW